MSNDYQDALSSMRRLTKMFKDMATVGKALEGVQELKNIEHEATVAKDKAVQEREAADAKLEQVMTSLREANEQVAHSEKKAADIQKAADATADSTRSQAKSMADQLLADAHAQAKELQEQIDRDFAKHGERVQEFDVEKASMEKEIAELRGVLDDLKERFN